MSYIPTEWKTGDIVTAEKLNKLEEGVASGGGGGGGLPEVDSTDNGKVLTVIDGAWAAGSGGSGGGLLVNLTWNEDNTSATLDKNFNEIKAAIHEGIMPIFAMLYEEEGVDDSFYVLVGLSSFENEYDVALSPGGVGEPLIFMSETATGTLTYTSDT